MQSHDESKGEADHGEEAESPNNVEDSLEYEERSSEGESPLQSRTPIFPTSDSLSSSSAAGNDGQPKRSAKQKGKTTPKITKSSTTKRPWASNARKANYQDIDMALLKTATSVADRVLQPEQPKKSRTEEDEDAIFC